MDNAICPASLDLAMLLHGEMRLTVLGFGPLQASPLQRRRKPMLTSGMAQDCERLIRDKCTEHGWNVLELAIQPDHSHLFVRACPTDSAADVVCEGVTSGIAFVG